MMKKLILILLPAILFWACSEEDEKIYTESDVAINILQPDDAGITGTRASVTAIFSVPAGLRYTNAGFCYSTASKPTIYSATVNATVSVDSLKAVLTGLTPKTTYHIRAFVCLYQGNAVYSDETVFTTGEAAGNELLAVWQPPLYPDYYVSLADWSSRDKWNLANVHDPTVMLADDGYYYMYQTDASYGNAHDGHGHFHARRSKDLVDWEYLGATMGSPPEWMKEKLNEYRTAMGLQPVAVPFYGYWAPVARKIKSGLYRMYYSVPVDNYIKTGAQNTAANFDGSWTERAFIGMMETADPASNVWTDKGFVVCSSSDKNLSYGRSSQNDWNAYFRWNAIDPSLVITPDGGHWLFYGSWHSGIVALQLNPETGKPLNTLGQPWGTESDISAYGSVVATRNKSSRWQGSEAPEAVYRNGYYYLFLAYDALDVPYNTRVVRSESVTGPYKGIDGKDVTNSGGEAFPVVTHPYKFSGSDGWVGISHCAVFDDGAGNWFFSSQGRFPANVNGNAYSNALMLGQVRSIRWTKDGWPLVMPERYAAVPKVPISEEELVGEWQLIDLSYSYGNQKTATNIALTADHKVSSGLWQGSGWTFDAGNAILTINGTDLYLQREADWEANPRRHTLVFAGYGSNNKTWWGKKN